MKRVLLFGASGNLGKAIGQELVDRGFDLTIVVRNERKAKALSKISSSYIIADACSKETLNGICEGQDIIVSAMGKSVSPNDKSKPSFRDVDLNGNLNILEEAKKSGIKKFVYVSAFHAEKYTHLEYFKVHNEFAEELKTSGIDYSIIKPPAIFCAFLDVIEMARKGKVITLGNGEHKTNPIYEGDLAKVCVDSINTTNTTIEAGGKTIYTRKELNEIVQSEVDPSKKIRKVPFGLFKFGLPIIKVLNKNQFDKFAFFSEVMQHDEIAPQIGEMKFEEYIRMKKNTTS